jgi:hypothetical protein
MIRFPFEQKPLISSILFGIVTKTSFTQKAPHDILLPRLISGQLRLPA